MDVKRFEKKLKHLTQEEILTGAISSLNMLLFDKGITSEKELQKYGIETVLPKNEDLNILDHMIRSVLAGKKERIRSEAESFVTKAKKPEVQLAYYDPDGEAAIVAGILFSSSKADWASLMAAAKKMSEEEKKRIISKYLEGRGERWQKVGRAFENAFMRFEIVLNAGAYRDLHRHRMHTQERQLFTVVHGYDIPPEIEEAGLADNVHHAIEKVEKLYQKIAAKLGEEHAQYATTLFHRVRFYQYQNVRQAFWEIELRTGPQGHPDYRHVEQEKFKLIQKAYSIIASFIKADMNEYDFARRGLEEKIQKKEEKLKEKFSK